MKTEAILNYIDKVKPPVNFSVKKFINAHSPKQRLFLNCKHHAIFFLGAKRAGKTLSGISRVIIADQEGIAGPRIVLAGANLEKIKSLYWNNLIRASKKLDLGWEFKSGDSIIETKKRQIVFRSLRDMANADKDTGFQVLMCLIEEGHTIRSHILQYYTDNIVRANFLGVPGACLILISNPPVYPLPIFESKFFLNREYKKFHITPADNPSIGKRVLKKFMEQEAKVLGYKSVAEASIKSNAFRRNIYGEWITDKGRIIIDKTRVLNYDKPPVENMEYVVGVDLGGGSAKDAIVVIGYTKYVKKAWVVAEEEMDTDNEDVDKLATKLKYYYEKYNPHAITIDTGGVGSRIATILRTRYGVPCVVPAIKKDKMAHIEEMKAEIYQERLLFKKDSSLVKEFPQIIYTEDRDAIDDVNGLHSDLFDACLYAMRFVFNAWPVDKPAKKSYKQERLQEIMKNRGRRKKGGLLMATLRFLDKTTKKPVLIDEKDFNTSLTLEPGRYIPLKGEEYFIKDEEGEVVKVDGSELVRTLGEKGGEILSHDKAGVELALKGEYSALGQFAKSVLSETLFLGVNKSKAIPKDPIARIIEAERQKQFGASVGAGTAVGTIAPFLAGGAGGVLRQGAKKIIKKQIAKKTTGTKIAMDVAQETGVKSAVGKGLEAFKFTPAVGVVKLATKAGDEAGKLAKNLGIGKTGQSIAKGAGITGTLGIAEGGVAGLIEAKAQKDINELDSNRQKYDGVFMAGANKAKEVMIGTSIWTAGLWGGAKSIKPILGLAGKVTKPVAEFADKAFGISPSLRKKTFFGTEPGARGQKSLELLKKSHFVLKKPDINTEAGKKVVLKDTIDFIDEMGILKGTKNRDQLLDAVNKKLGDVGMIIGDTRKRVYELVKGKPISQEKLFKRYNEKLQSLIDDVSPVERASLLKPYVSTLENIKATLKDTTKDTGFKMKYWNDTMQVLARKAKYSKREAKELEVDKAYRKAYTLLSGAEDKIYASAGKFYKDKGVNITGFEELKKQKDVYSDLVNVQEVLERAMPTGTQFLFNFHTIGSRDTLLGVLGYYLGGFPGAIAGGLASRGIAGLRAQGAGIYNLATIRNMEKDESICKQ